MPRIPENPTVTNAGATVKIDIVLKNYDQAALLKASIDSLSLRVVDEDGEVVNGRDWQDILDVNGGYIDTDGACRVKLGDLDTAWVGDSTDRCQLRYVAVQWTWTDTDGDEGVGIEPFTLEINRMPV